MKKNKIFKGLFITFFSITIICCGILSYLFVFKPTNNEKQPTETDFIDRFFIAQTAIFNEDFSHNYNGVYKFSRLNFLYVSKLSEKTQQAIYEKFKVDDTMSLIKYFNTQKVEYVKLTNETLIIENNRFQFNHNTKPYQIGQIYGNDDYSVLYNDSYQPLYTVSLTNLSQDKLKETSIEDSLIYFGDELYLTTFIDIEIDEMTYNLEAVYVYKLQK